MTARQTGTAPRGHLRVRPRRAEHYAVFLCVWLSTTLAVPGAAAGQWIWVVQPDPWNASKSDSIRPYAVVAGERFRIQGQAWHPQGIHEVLIDGVAAELTWVVQDTTADFRGQPQAQIDQSAIRIEIVPRSGSRFTETYPLRVDPGTDVRRFEGTWSTPDSLILAVGLPDTVEVRMQDQPGLLVPSHLLQWSSSNAAVLSIDSEGILLAHAPGSATVSATGLGRQLSVLVRIYPRPRSVLFTPQDSVVRLVVDERQVWRADLMIGEQQWLRGVVPELTGADAAILRRESPGVYLAVRDGSTTLHGRIAGQERSWRVEVTPPLIRARLEYGAVLIGDSTALPAARTAPNGDILGPAVGATWQSDQPATIAIADGAAHARGPGRAVLTASLGSASDTMTVFGLGDVLFDGEDSNGRFVGTAVLGSRRSFHISPDSLDAGEAVLSPDGRTIAIVLQPDGRRARIFLMDPDGQNIRQLVPEPSGRFGISLGYRENTPRWSHDGRHIFFFSDREGNYDVFSVRADGTDVRRLTTDGNIDWRPAPAPDAPMLAFERVVAPGDSDVFVALADGSGASALQFPPRYPPTRVSESRPALLPGGALLVFARGAPNLDANAGQALVLYDLSEGRVVRDILQPVPNAEIIFAVSPDGERIAYHQRARSGRRNSIITIIDMNGQSLQSVTIDDVRQIHDLSWGVRPAPSSNR